MTAEILETLQSIETALYWLVVIVVLGVVANFARTAVSMKNLVKKELGDEFQQEANDLYEKGEIEKLLAVCDQKVASRPNLAYALWYKAKAEYLLKDYDSAIETLNKLSNVEPSWHEGYVQPYLQKIEAIQNEER